MFRRRGDDAGAVAVVVVDERVGQQAEELGGAALIFPIRVCGGVPGGRVSVEVVEANRSAPGASRGSAAAPVSAMARETSPCGLSMISWM